MVKPAHIWYMCMLASLEGAVFYFWYAQFQCMTLVIFLIRRLVILFYFDKWYNKHGIVCSQSQQGIMKCPIIHKFIQVHHTLSVIVKRGTHLLLSCQIYNIIVVAQMKCLDRPVVVLMFPIWEVVDLIAYCINGKVLQLTFCLHCFYSNRNFLHSKKVLYDIS